MGEESFKSPFVEKLEGGTVQTIVLYGTSLTHTGQWSMQFSKVMKARYVTKAIIKNAAKSGSDSNWGLANIKKRVFPHKPDVLFIEFSMNDAIEKRGTSIEKAQENLEMMLDLTLKEFPKCEIILMSMNPSLRSKERTIRPHLPAYYDSYEAVAKKRGLQFIDNEKAWTDFLSDGKKDGALYIPDSIHPNGLGTKMVITPNILKAIGVAFSPEEIPQFPDPVKKKKK